MSGTALDLPYARLKGDAMIRDEFPASFPVAGALATVEGIAAAGYADADMAAASHGVRA